MGVGSLHHVTAIVSEASRSLDFYARVLGLRLVKRTVSHGDPGSYHLYFGDDLGRPGTIFSLFVWTGAAPGRRGKAEAERIVLCVPAGSLDWWNARLERTGVPVRRMPLYLDAPGLDFRDPDGVPLAIVGRRDRGNGSALQFGPAESRHAILGLLGVALAVADIERTAAILTNLFGFQHAEQTADDVPLRHPDDLGGLISLRAVREARGRPGCGTISHVALRASGPHDQDRIARRLRSEYGISTSAPRDRTYYRSIYFREPGGLLFEIATDGPGFTVDESADELGNSLRLPPHLENRCDDLNRILPQLP